MNPIYVLQFASIIDVLHKFPSRSAQVHVTEPRYTAHEHRYSWEFHREASIAGWKSELSHTFGGIKNILIVDERIFIGKNSRKAYTSVSRFIIVRGSVLRVI